MCPNPDGSLSAQEMAEISAQALRDAIDTAARNQALALQAQAEEAARQQRG